MRPRRLGCALGGRSTSPLDNPMLRLATITACAAVGSVAFAADSPRWIQMSGGAWEAQALPFREIEKSLRPLVIAASQGMGRIPEWKTYTFQYQGQHTPLGRRYVYINAFCDLPKNHPSDTWVLVLDGGACFFQAKYDPESKQLYDVSVNGIG